MNKIKLFLPLIIALALSIAASSCMKKEANGNLVWHGDYMSDSVYITFDDGPHPEYTPKILDILKKHDAKATFFLVGEWAKKYPEIVGRIHEEGHELGNHTYSHSDGMVVDELRIEKEIAGTDRLIRGASNSIPRYFRPPFGFFNFRFIRLAEKLGYKTVLWTFDVGDWGKISSDAMTKKVLDRARGGSIILLHDGGGNREELVEALPGMIVGLRAKGYKISPLSEIFCE